MHSTVGIGDVGIVSEVSAAGVGGVDAEGGAGLESARAVAESLEGVEIGGGELTGATNIKRSGGAGFDDQIGCRPVGRGVVVKGDRLGELQYTRRDCGRAGVGVGAREGEGARTGLDEGAGTREMGGNGASVGEGVAGGSEGAAGAGDIAG